MVGNDGCYRFANRACEQWCGRPRGMVVGRSLPEVLGEDDYQRSLAWVQRALAGETVSFEKDTGVLKRAGFERYLQHKVQEGDATGLALLYIDLDRFKPINDTHDHPVGDEVLRRFAARLGGDEFAIVLSGVREKANADTVANKVVEAAHAPFYTGALKLEIGASVGVAQGAGDGEGWQGLVARADAMVYRAKAEGRGRRA